MAVSSTKLNHPAIFPEKLAHDHIASWSNEGDTILDPFAGSGTVGKIAKQLNRNCILIEKVSEYFKIAEKRIKEISVEDMQKIVDANEKLIKELKDVELLRQ